MKLTLNIDLAYLLNSFRKIQSVLTTRVLKFLYEKSTKDAENFEKFYKDYGLFLKEGIVTTHDQMEKEDIAKLLRFETNKSGENVKIGLDEYLKHLKENQKDIYYLAAPSRQLALTSPYFESLKKVFRMLLDLNFLKPFYLIE